MKVNIERIQEYIVENQLTIKEFAESVGISAYSMSLILRRKSNPNSLTVGKIVSAIRCAPSELLKEA